MAEWVDFPGVPYIDRNVVSGGQKYIERESQTEHWKVRSEDYDQFLRFDVICIWT